MLIRLNRTYRTNILIMKRSTLFINKEPLMAVTGESERMSETQSSCFHLGKMRERIKSYVDNHHYESALFWADKLVTLSKDDVDDVYWYAQTLFHTGQYHRAANILLVRKLHKNHLNCRYLAAKCYYECKDYQEALNILDYVEPVGFQPINKRMSFNVNQSITEQEPANKSMESSINLLRGKIYEAMENGNLATECYREALRQDVYCYEAFDLLVNHHKLSAQEERLLLDSLPFGMQCHHEEEQLIKYLYETKLKKYDKPAEAKVPDQLHQLTDNLDIIVNLAERHYYNCDFKECLKLTTRVLKEDPYNSNCLPTHIAVLVELQKKNNLFYLAHKLVDLYPNKAVSWFAVGCYYLLIDHKDPARRYLTKATTLDKSYGPAWLAFGHSFAAGKEHDQAMAAYFTAAQLMKGLLYVVQIPGIAFVIVIDRGIGAKQFCHLPALYIGLEYGLTNNPKLAEKFFNEALTIAPEDPFVLHEKGVIAFQNEDFQLAERHFKDALEKVQNLTGQSIVEKWEMLLNNLGHTYRKLKRYEEALEYHQQSLVLNPHNASTLTSIGFVYSLKEDSLTAIDYFHKALAIRRDDAFSTTMLGNLTESLITELSAVDDAEDIHMFTAPTTTSFPEFTLPKPPPIMNLRATLEESSTVDTSVTNNTSVADSSLTIEEVEMGDYD